MSKAIFVTGTGTDIGKTYVCGLIAKTLTEARYNCGYYKPVLSGALNRDGKLFPGDCEFVIKKANLNQEGLKSLTYVFEEAVSPHLAAKHAGIKIEPEKILADYNSKTVDYLIVEGAGGITCPLLMDDKPYLMSDLISALGLEIIIVADAGLGTINSVLLTVEYAKQKDIKIAGIILNNYIYGDLMYEDNIKTIEKLCDTPIIGLVEKNGETIDFRGYNLPGVFKERNN